MRTLCGLSLSVAVVLALVFTTKASAQLTSYSQDFEGLTQSDPDALGNEGWLVNGLVFNGGGGFKFFYGNFSAPNAQPGEAFSNIEDGQGGPAQGTQYLNTFSDYNCCGLTAPGPEGHGNGTDMVHSNIFREQIIGAGDVGKTMEFSFDAKLPGGTEADFALASPSLGDAFIRTIEPVAPFGVSAEVVLDVSTILNDATWTSHTISFDITPALDGHFFQFGFHNQSSNFDPTGVYYDNISLQDPSAIFDEADFDENGTVDGVDLSAWESDFGLAAGATKAQGDADSDLDVDGADFIVWQQQFAGSSPAVAASAAIPEPSALILAALGFCVFFTRRPAKS